MAAQAKLLRAIQDLAVERVGGHATRRLNVRIVAATNKPLAGLAERGLFRSDLYYRLSGLDVQVPPLRARREDILELAHYFLACHDDASAGSALSTTAADALQAYQWPGNVRELQRTLEGALAMCSSRMIDLDDLPPALRAPVRRRRDARRSKPTTRCARGPAATRGWCWRGRATTNAAPAGRSASAITPCRRTSATARRSGAARGAEVRRGVARRRSLTGVCGRSTFKRIPARQTAFPNERYQPHHPPQEDPAARRSRRPRRPHGAATAGGTCRSNTPASPPNTWRCAPPPGSSTYRTWARSSWPVRTRWPPCSTSSTNDAAKLQNGQAQYSALTTPEGTFVDDVLVYRFAERHYLLVVNASNIDKDYAWIAKHAPEAGEVAIVNSQRPLRAHRGAGPEGAAASCRS